MKSQKNRGDNKKEQFLEDNENLREISEDVFMITDSCEVTSDDELWLVQCPKTINIENLKSCKIKIPGKTHYDKNESVAEEFNTVKNITLGIKSNHGYCMKSFPIQGRVLVREQLKTIKADEIESSSVSKKAYRMPFPEGLKQRHPLHGADYKKKLEISDVITARLKDQGPVIQKETKKQSLSNKISGEVHIKHEKDIENLEDDVEFVSEFKIKQEKRKRKKKNSLSIEEDTTGKVKNIKKSTEDDEEPDLAWIKSF